MLGQKVEINGVDYHDQIEGYEINWYSHPGPRWNPALNIDKPAWEFHFYGSQLDGDFNVGQPVRFFVRVFAHTVLSGGATESEPSYRTTYQGEGKVGKVAVSDWGMDVYVEGEEPIQRFQEVGR